MRLWRSQVIDYNNAEKTAHLNTGSPNGSELTKLTMRQLAVRAHEMVQCEAVDPGNLDRYDFVTGGVLEVRKNRYKLFVERHGLERQLFQEDEAGVR